MSTLYRECEPRLVRILAAQYNALARDPHPNLLAWMDPTDLRVWYFLAVGLDRPYLGGEYIFRLTASDEFPHKPPRFEFLTQNGVFQPGGPICISVGEFHTNDLPGKGGSYGWRPSLGMAGFAAQVVNGMICSDLLDSGIRIVVVHESLKMLYACKSRELNSRQYPELAAAFEELIRTTMSGSAPVANLWGARRRLAGQLAPPRRDIADKSPASLECYSVSPDVYVDNTVAVRLPEAMASFAISAEMATAAAAATLAAAEEPTVNAYGTFTDAEGVAVDLEEPLDVDTEGPIVGLEETFAEEDTAGAEDVISCGLDELVDSSVGSIDTVEPAAEEAIAEEAIAEEAIAEEPATEEPAVEEPAAEVTVIDAADFDLDALLDSLAGPIVAGETVAEEPATEEPAEETATEEPAEETAAEEAAEEEIAEETAAEETAEETAANYDLDALIDSLVGP